MFKQRKEQRNRRYTPWSTIFKLIHVKRCHIFQSALPSQGFRSPCAGLLPSGFLARCERKWRSETAFKGLQEVEEMIQQLRALVALGWPRAFGSWSLWEWKERTSFTKLSSDLHMSTVAHVCPPTHTHIVRSKIKWKQRRIMVLGMFEPLCVSNLVASRPGHIRMAVDWCPGDPGVVTHLFSSGQCFQVPHWSEKGHLKSLLFPVSVGYNVKQAYAHYL